MDQYQKFIGSSRYARWREELKRRETWPNSAQRYVDFFAGKGYLKKGEAAELLQAITNLDTVPSMRCIMTAGPALDRDNVAGFNCSYLAIDHPRAFDELMYVLMCGTGVGFSVERSYVKKLPDVAEEFHSSDTCIKVRDSKIGWCKALRELISLLYSGQKPTWDVSGVRPAGERLKVFGGRASGPQPLVDLFHFAVRTFEGAAGRQLNSLECHDLCCKIADVIVVGGVRRSALIGLSDPTDNRLRVAKSGQWWLDNNQRALANNSACYTDKPDFDLFLAEMTALYESRSGERGIFNRQSAEFIASRNGRRELGFDWGTNPCSEIILRNKQFCNLSEVIIRPEDTLEDLKRKVGYAAIFGTMQATLTDFRYLRSVWKKNTEEEALLGVSFTGIMDHEVMSDRGKAGELEKWLNVLREHAVEVNKVWAKRLGINQSAAITCVKPSGTVSQLANSASGIHPRFSRYYIRTVRADKKDPLAQYMQEAGFPCEDDLMKDSNLVFSFPIKSPDSSVCVSDVGALQQLKLWKTYQENWCEHKPSITVYYTEDEFLEVFAWIWQNWDIVSGISLLPYSDHTYQQAPYQEITRAQYEEALAAMPLFDWDAAAAYEQEDMTEGSQTLACVGNSCEL